MHKMGVREIRRYETGHIMSFGFDALGNTIDQRTEYMYMWDKNLKTFYRTYNWQDTMFHNRVIKRRYTPKPYKVDAYEYDLQCCKCGHITVIVGNDCAGFEHHRCYKCKPFTIDELQERGLS